MGSTGENQLTAKLGTICENKAKELEDIHKQLSIAMNVMKEYETVVSDWKNRCITVASKKNITVTESCNPSMSSTKRRSNFQLQNCTEIKNKEIKVDECTDDRPTNGKEDLARAGENEANEKMSTDGHSQKKMNQEISDRILQDIESSGKKTIKDVKFPGSNSFEVDKTTTSRGSKSFTSIDSTVKKMKLNDGSSCLNGEKKSMPHCESHKKEQTGRIPCKQGGRLSISGTSATKHETDDVQKTEIFRNHSCDNNNSKKRGSKSKSYDEAKKNITDDRSCCEASNLPPIMMCTTCLEKKKNQSKIEKLETLLVTKAVCGNNINDTQRKGTVSGGIEMTPNDSSFINKGTEYQTLHGTYQKCLEKNSSRSGLTDSGKRELCMSTIGLIGENVSLNAKQVRWSDETKDDSGIYSSDVNRTTGIYLDPFENRGIENTQKKRHIMRKEGRLLNPKRGIIAVKGTSISSPDGHGRFNFCDDNIKDKMKVSQQHIKEMLLDMPVILNDGVKQSYNTATAENDLCGWIDNSTGIKTFQNGNARPVEKTNRKYWFDVSKSVVCNPQLPQLQPLQGRSNPPKYYESKKSKFKPKVVKTAVDVPTQEISDIFQDTCVEKPEPPQIKSQVEDLPKKINERTTLKPGIVKQHYFDPTDLPQNLIPKRGFRTLSPLKVAGKPLQAKKDNDKESQDPGKIKQTDDALHDLLHGTLMSNTTSAGDNSNRERLEDPVKLVPVKESLKPLPSPRQRTSGKQMNWTNKNVGRVKLPPLNLEYLRNPVEKQSQKHTPDRKLESNGINVTGSNASIEELPCGGAPRDGNSSLDTSICMLGRKIGSNFPPITRTLQEIKKTQPEPNIIPIDLVRIALKAKRSNHGYNHIGNLLNEVGKVKDASVGHVCADYYTTLPRRKITRSDKRERSYYANGKLYNDESICNDEPVKMELNLLRRNLKGQIDEDTDSSFQWYYKLGSYFDDMETDRSGNARPCSLSSSIISL